MLLKSLKDKLKNFLQDVEDYNNYLVKYAVNKYLLTKYTPQDLYYINTADNLMGTVNNERLKILQSEFFWLCNYYNMGTYIKNSLNAKRLDIRGILSSPVTVSKKMELHFKHICKTR